MEVTWKAYSSMVPFRKENFTVQVNKLSRQSVGKFSEISNKHYIFLYFFYIFQFLLIYNEASDPNRKKDCRNDFHQTKSSYCDERKTEKNRARIGRN